MRYPAIATVIAFLAAVAPNDVTVNAQRTGRTSSSQSSFPAKCISTSRVTEKVAGRTVTTTYTLPTSSSTQYQNATGSFHNATITSDKGFGSLSGSGVSRTESETAGSSPTVICSSISGFASACSCVSVSLTTTTSTVRSSTATLTVTKSAAASTLKSSSTAIKTSSSKASSSKASSTKTTSIKATSTKSSSTKRTSTRTTSTKATSTRAASTKTSSTRTSSTRATSTKATSTKSSSTKVSSTRATSTKSSSTKPTSTKASSIKSSSTKSSSIRATSTRSSSIRSSSTRSSSTRSSSTRSSLARTSSTRATSTKSSSTKSSSIRSSSAKVGSTSTKPSTTNLTTSKASSSTAPFPLLNSTIASFTGTGTGTGSVRSTIYVNTTTLITVTTSKDTSASSGFSLPISLNATTSAPYLNHTVCSTSLTASRQPSRGFSFPWWRINMTASRTRPYPSGTGRPTKLPPHSISLITGTGTGMLNSTSSRPLWSNTSYPLSPNSTAPPFLNTTAAPSLTGTGYSSGTGGIRLTNSTSVRWANTSATSTTISSSTPTPTFPTSCGGENATGFALQVSASGVFNNWFVHLSGHGLLFTSQKSSASQFSVEPSGHLCVVGLLDEQNLPYVAVVGTHDERSMVWMTTNDTLRGDFSDDYAALGCDVPGIGGSLSCRSTNGTAFALENWLGCGIQLGLGSEGEEGNNGLNCVGIQLGVADAEGQGRNGSSNGEATEEGVRFERRVVNPFAFGKMSSRG